MIKFIDRILQQFQICFKRKETFIWFAIIIMGFIMRTNYRGITSIIGTLYLNPIHYETMIHFFRSKALNIDLIRSQWQSIVFKNIEPVMLHNRVIIIGDHIKIGKEAEKMPGVKKLYQDSENLGKAKYIFGHQHGAIGVLAEGKTLQCIPLDIGIHDGVNKIEEFKNELKNTNNSNNSNSVNGSNCIEKIMKMVKQFVSDSKKEIILLLDAYFSNATAFNYVYNANKENEGNQIILITRAKSNSVGYKLPEISDKKKVGRPKIYGERIKFKDLFKNKLEGATKATVKLYDKKEEIEYLCLDVLWKPVKRMCRFVLVKTQEKTMILICSDLNVDPIDIILGYSYRFKIEVTFKTLKHTIRGFFYHFWTSAMPKLSIYKKETDLSVITEDSDKEKIILTLKAIETFTLLSCIAMGMLTIISLKFESNIWERFTGWLRTKSSDVPSVETTKTVLYEEWLMNFRNLDEYDVLSQIQKYQREFKDNVDKLAS